MLPEAWNALSDRTRMYVRRLEVDSGSYEAGAPGEFDGEPACPPASRGCRTACANVQRPMSEEECRFYLHLAACPLATVPDVVGSTEEAARSTLDAAGFLAVLAFTMPTSDPDKDGTVVVQDPVQGGSIVVGSNVVLVIARIEALGHEVR